ncbi:MAG TPA: hypothetical protein VIL36_09315 [Acidimicrobiales bacterium]
MSDDPIGAAPPGPRVAWHAADPAADPVAAGADLLELDVAFSAELEPVVHHNYLLEETAWVHETPLADTGCPTLRDVLSRLDGTGLPLLLDLKTAFVDPAAAYDRVVAVVTAAAMTDRVTLVNWDHDAGAAAARRHPGVRVGLASRWLGRDVADLVRRSGCAYLYIDWEYLTPGLLAAARAAGVEVGTLEGWHPLFYERAVAWGLPVVLSNDPAACRARLRQAAGH